MCVRITTTNLLLLGHPPPLHLNELVDRPRVLVSAPPRHVIRDVLEVGPGDVHAAAAVGDLGGREGGLGLGEGFGRGLEEGEVLEGGILTDF